MDTKSLAEALPDRPLTPDEVEDIAEQFDASVQTVRQETAAGTPYVPTFYLWVPDDIEDDEPRGSALGFRLDSSLSDWSGETMERSVTQDTWMQVNKLWAAEMGAEIELQSVVLERDGNKSRRDLTE